MPMLLSAAPIGKRGWKMFYATMRDMVIYLHKDEHGFKKSALVADNMSNCIRIHHALATKATDYRKKQHVFRLQTADWAQYLFQTRYTICDQCRIVLDPFLQDCHTEIVLLRMI